MALPDKPSELIELALADLEKVEADREHYRVDMGAWHEPKYGLCYVCLAGAVMAKTMNFSRIDSVDPVNSVHSPGDENKLMALNEFRVGMIDHGLHYMGITDKAELLPDRLEHEPYAARPVIFKGQMRALAKMFRDVGL